MTKPVQDEREILIAGLGSVGRRHLANLRALGWSRIRLYRTGKSTLPDGDLAGLPVDHDLNAALSHRPLAVIVTNPTALHMPVALAAARAGAHLLIEKPVSDSLERIEELKAVVRSHNLHAMVAFQFRFHPTMRQIKSWVDAGAIGAVVTAQAHWGEYLPGMHPWEDHRIGYAARKDLGGGVLLTLCHPFDYLRWIVGDIDDVSAVDARGSAESELSRLNVDSCVDVNLRFANGATGHVHLNFFQRPTEHRFVIVGTGGTITWSQHDHAAHLHSAASGDSVTVAAPDGFERNDMFLDEMREFLACVRGEAAPSCTLVDGEEALRVSVAAQRSLADVTVLAGTR